MMVNKIISLYFVKFIISCTLLFKQESSAWITSAHIPSPKVRIQTACYFDIGLKHKCFNKDEYNDTTTSFPTLDENNTFIFIDDIDQPQFIEFQCIAPYPVEWVHFQEQWLTLTNDDWITTLRHQKTVFMRTVKSLDDVSTFTYTALFSLHNIFSSSDYALGRYSCQGVDAEYRSLSTQMHVYRQREAYGKVFPLSQKNVTVWIADQKSIIFPCYVTNPNVSVKLYQRILTHVQHTKGNMTPSKRLSSTHLQSPVGKRSIESTPVVANSMIAPTVVQEAWNMIHENLVFEPDQGFILQQESSDKYSFHVTPGLYKCAAFNDGGDGEDYGDGMKEIPEEYVLINLESGKKPIDDTRSYNQKMPLRGKAHFNYSVLGGVKQFTPLQINCCSNSSDPPNLYFISCLSKSSCKRVSKLLSEVRQGPHREANKLTKAVENCRSSRNISTFSNPLHARCIGDGIDYGVTFIFPVVQTENISKPYLGWEDVNPAKMLSLKPVKWNHTTAEDNQVFILYENQTITFQCITSTAYFSVGTRLTIEFQNGDRKLIEDNMAAQNNIHFRWRNMNSLDATITASKQMTSITCHAAVVNSDQWVKATVKVKVLDGANVTIFESDEEPQEVYWTLNENKKELKCEFAGTPAPEIIVWNKDNQIITNGKGSNSTYYYYAVPSKNITILTVKQASYDTHGRYYCVVGNIFGNATKTFHVFVRAPESSWIFLSAFLGLACLTIALIFLAVHIQRHRNMAIFTAKKDPFNKDSGF